MISEGRIRILTISTNYSFDFVFALYEKLPSNFQKENILSYILIQSMKNKKSPYEEATRLQENLQELQLLKICK